MRAQSLVHLGKYPRESAILLYDCSTQLPYSVPSDGQRPDCAFHFQTLPQ
jgi:hypothetical protein